MDDKPSDFLNTFEKTIKKVAKQNRVSEKDLMDYFEKKFWQFRRTKMSFKMLRHI